MINTQRMTMLLVNLSRLLLSLVLLLSGFVKAVDPVGLSYKLQEYFAAFGIDNIGDGWFLLGASLLSAVEFITGVLLLMGVYVRGVTLLTFLFFLLFTPLTL
ncbi:MAG: DoxX family protein, partial [Bacteroidaceae bacterium]|nr:DoxX family protein [Bacteroidaceae bacterium]